LRVTLLNLFARHGGAETCARNLLEGLRRRGHEAGMLIGRADGDLPPHVELLPRFFPEFAVQRLLSRLGGLTDTAMLLPLWHAWRHPRLVDVDVVHGHILNGSYLNLWSLPILARQTPLVVTLHDMWLLTGDCGYSEACMRFRRQCGACPMVRRPRGQRNSVGWGDLTRFNLAIKRAVFRQVPPDRLVVVSPSQWLARLAVDSLLGGFRIEVIPNGLDLRRLAPCGDRAGARRALALPSERLFLAMAANWANPHKGGRWLPALAAALSQAGLGKLVVAGQVPADLAGQLRTAQAVLFGPVSDDTTLQGLLSSCDAALLLSRNENFPYAVSEALACGCPVIARGVGGVPEMIEHGLTGYCLPGQAGVDDYLRAAREFAALSPDRAEAMRQAARALAVQAYGQERMVDRYEALYRELATRGRLVGERGVVSPRHGPLPVARGA
jgi:glycosyltransferase involved in cell wall biosynthesis